MSGYNWAKFLPIPLSEFSSFRHRKNRFQWPRMFKRSSNRLQMYSKAYSVNTSPATAAFSDTVFKKWVRKIPLCQKFPNFVSNYRMWQICPSVVRGCSVSVRSKNSGPVPLILVVLIPTTLFQNGISEYRDLSAESSSKKVNVPKDRSVKHRVSRHYASNQEFCSKPASECTCFPRTTNFQEAEFFSTPKPATLCYDLKFSKIKFRAVSNFQIFPKSFLARFRFIPNFRCVKSDLCTNFNEISSPCRTIF